MKTAQKISQPDQLDRAEQAIITRLQARIDDPRFGGDPDYKMAMQHAIGIVQTEIGFVRDAR
jgi:hypothetical protein